MPYCTHKQVTRFYYRGKGYGSKLSAYKSAAKEDLLTQVFGASSTFEWKDTEHSQYFTGRPGLHGKVLQAQEGHYRLVGGVSTSTVEYVNPTDFGIALMAGTASRSATTVVPEFDWDAAMKEVFADGMREFGFECDYWDDMHGNEGLCCDDTFAFCGLKYKAWITDRAKEMMKEDENEK